jgi:hypothetical protein
LSAGLKLNPGQYLQSSAGQYYAVLQTDGNFVIYLTSPFQAKHAIWTTGTQGSSLQRPFSLFMQGDGNLVMYDQYNRAVWESKTSLKGQAPHRLILQADGNLVIYDANRVATWSSRTFNYRICN